MKQTEVIALLVDDKNRVARVVFDGLGLELTPDTPAVDIAAFGAHSKVEQIIHQAREKAIVVDWEITLRTDEGTRLCRVSATALGDQVFVFGNAGDSDAYDLYEELMRINNEQTTALRMALKKIARGASEPYHDQQPRTDSALKEEIHRLTNAMNSLQRSLDKKNQDVRQLDHHRNQLLGMVAHDLRNPLGSIVGLSELLLLTFGSRLDKRGRDMLTNIQSASNFMLGLIEDLLDFAAIESGQIRLDYQRADLHSLLHDIVERNRPFARRKRMTIAFEADRVVLDIDVRKIQQVVDNLVSNAVKYSGKNTTVRVLGRQDQAHALVEIVDNGQGIPADEQDKLFLPFATTSVRGTAGEKSTGLGLAIARKVVEAHRGEIGLDSAVGKGSRFWFRLPLDATHNPS